MEHADARAAGPGLFSQQVDEPETRNALSREIFGDEETLEEARLKYLGVRHDEMKAPVLLGTRPRFDLVRSLPVTASMPLVPLPAHHAPPPSPPQQQSRESSVLIPSLGLSRSPFSHPCTFPPTPPTEIQSPPLPSPRYEDHSDPVYGEPELYVNFDCVDPVVLETSLEEVREWADLALEGARARLPMTARRPPSASPDPSQPAKEKKVRKKKYIRVADRPSHPKFRPPDASSTTTQRPLSISTISVPSRSSLHQHLHGINASSSSSGLSSPPPLPNELPRDPSSSSCSQSLIIAPFPHSFPASHSAHPTSLPTSPRRLTALEKGKGREVDSPLSLAFILNPAPPPVPPKKRRGRVYKDRDLLARSTGKKPRVGHTSNQPDSFGTSSIGKPTEGTAGAQVEGTAETSHGSDEPERRPRLGSRPPVWAYSRQEMCETLPYWRAFQSGLYMMHGTAFGYLLEGYPSQRDIWAHDGRVVISHGGGKCIEFESPHPNSPDTEPPVKIVRLREDQAATDPRVSTLLAAYKNRTPIVLVAGNGYAGMPFDLGCGYAVLGWFWISLVWIEAEEPAPGSKRVKGRDFFHRYKVRFDWVQSQGDPWWTVNDPSLPNGWDPREERSAIQKRRQGLPVDYVPRIDHHEDPSPPSKEGLPVVAAPATREDSSSESMPGPPRSPSPSPSPEPDAAPESTDRPRLSGLANFSSESSWSSDSSQSSSLSEAPFLFNSASCEESGAENHKLDDIMEEPTSPAEKARRRLPGEGGVRKLSNFRPPNSQIIADEASEFTSSRSHRSCESCTRPSPVIYSEGWMCVQLDCPKFFQILRPSDYSLSTPPAVLTYTAEFLAPAATPAKVQRIPHDVVPPAPVELAEIEDGLTTSRAFWRGMVCLQCRKASSRERWDCWKCTSCSAVYAPLAEYARVVGASELALPACAPPILGDDVLDTTSGIILVVGRQVCATNNTPIAEVLRYVLPNDVGSIWHVKPFDLTPFDAIFEAYQAQELDATKEKKLAASLFFRTAIKQHTAVGRLLTQQFTFNSGADYKFVAQSQDALPFSDAPWAVTEALRQIKQNVLTVCGIDEDFNELLSVAYKTDQKMNWHDDGESGLGPVVSSLSLGSDAEMSFRAKPPRKNRNMVFHKHKPETDASTTVDEANVEAKQDGDGKQAAKVIKSGGQLGAAEKKPAALTLRLMHGDFVVMEGEELQRSWEHAVAPSGFRIAATARRITEEHGK